jgi:hypothetical protein
MAACRILLWEAQDDLEVGPAETAKQMLAIRKMGSVLAVAAPVPSPILVGVGAVGALAATAAMVAWDPPTPSHHREGPPMATY